MAEPEATRASGLRLAIAISLSAWIVAPVIGGVQAAIFKERGSVVVAYTCLTVAVGGLIAWIVLRFVRQVVEDRLAREAFSHAAERLGLWFASEQERWSLEGMRFAFFRKPHTCAQVLSGEVRGRPVLAFQFQEEGASPLVGRMVIRRSTGVVTELGDERALPHLRIRPRGRVGRFLHRHPSEGFTGSFRRQMVVRCADHDFASRTIESIGGRVSAEVLRDLTLEFSGGHALCCTPRGPVAIEEMVDVMSAFVDVLPQVPRYAPV